MAWRLATSLVGLRNEVNTLAPNRSKASDGTIGDPAHASRCSRHNPNDFGVVCALDLTHDPAGGCDIHAIAEQVRARPHPNLDYVISNGRIAKRSLGWTWRTYLGSNPHKTHAHFGVGVGSDCEPRPPYDDLVAWGIAPTPPPPAPPPPPHVPTFGEKVRMLPTLKEGSTGQYVRNMQGLLQAHGNMVAVDGVFGPATKRTLAAWQARTGRLTPDGICGPATWSWLVGV